MRMMLLAGLLTVGQCYQLDYPRERWQTPITSKVIEVGKRAYRISHYTSPYGFLGDWTQDIYVYQTKREIPLKVVPCPK